ncbi:flagellar biosynthesis anti-sigma factor FlgM [Enterococcus sp.]|uniref:flagellar biosynthesis anti-sigma factor FlgM n=1 Tax=Enterococcus sp. TaxID=35783 RepID=UPI002FCC4774
MKIERSYGEYNKELYNQKKAADQATIQDNLKSSFEQPVKLSDAAQKIRNNQTVDQGNAEKIAAIKKAIQDGTYKVSPKEITDSMWQHMKGE